MFARTRSRKRRKSGRRVFVHKPRGALHPKVQQVGPEHFGIACFDVAKSRSEWMLCDFYGKVILDPGTLCHARGDFQAAVLRVQDAMERHSLKEVVVAIERTGNYHLPVKRAFAAAGFETRIVHPFATKQFRQTADPGNKTDETDLAAIFRATVAGFGMLELASDPVYWNLRLLARHRRDLVYKQSALCCQIREHLEALMPGYAARFDQFWNNAAALEIVRRFPSAASVLEAGTEEIGRVLKSIGRRFRWSTIETVIAWAPTATDPDPAASIHHRLWQALDDDRSRKLQEIQELEQDLTGLLAKTPYVLLLSVPGISAITAAELAGEMGPIEHYANAKAITGRAGLFPSRYQSDQVDHPNGKLIRCSNRSLRSIIMLISNNLIQCNGHFRGLAANWKAQGKDPRDTRVKVASRFTRIAFQMVAGRLVFHHPGCRGRDYVLQKLLTFLQARATPLSTTMNILQDAAGQLPKATYSQEALPLQREVEKAITAKRGPKPIGDILTVVLARLGVTDVQSTMSEAQDPN